MRELAWKKTRTREGEWVGLNDDEKEDGGQTHHVEMCWFPTEYGYCTYKYIKVLTVAVHASTYQYVQ